MKARWLCVSLAALAASQAAAQPATISPDAGNVPAPGVRAGMIPDGLQPHAAPAPVPTQITPDTGALGLGTSATRAGNVTTIDGGTRAGNNLFHSFSRFDLGQGDFARWVHSAGDPASIRNVVNRVTGGDPSDIFGTIDSTGLPNANFFFINPAGIVFGDGARIDVPASAHFSTAAALRFADGSSFTVTTPGGSSFSVANVAGFGFLGGQGDVAMHGGRGMSFTGTRLSLTGRNVTMLDSQIAADGFALAAVGGGSVEISLAAPRTITGNGRLLIADSVLRSSGADGILLSGGIIDLTNAGIGTAFAPGRFDGVGGPIDINGRIVTILNSLISASTSGPEPAGEIRIAGQNITIAGGSMIQSETDRGSTGEAGAIRINGDAIDILDGSRISSSTLTAAQSGAIFVNGRAVRIMDGSVLASDVRPGTTGSAGSIQILGSTLTMENGATLSSVSEGFGQAGLINIFVDSAIRLTRSNIISEARGQSSGAGIVSLNASSIMLDNAVISTTTNTSGDAGVVGISTDDMELRDRSVILSISAPGAAGNAGQVSIQRRGETGGRLLLTGGSAIRSDTNGPGNAGGISIGMDRVSLIEGGAISSDSGLSCANVGCGPLGRAGDIDITGVSLTMLDTDPFDGLETVISSDSIGGTGAGTIRLTLSGDLDSVGFGQVSSDTIGGNAGAGAGGDVVINAENVRFSGSRSGISSGTFGPGQGGSVTINARNQIVLADEAAILSQSGDGRVAGNAPPGQGSSGSITLNARDILITSGGTISASTFTDGKAGAVTIRAGSLRMINQALLGSFSQGQGEGGLVDIDVGELIMVGAASIDTGTGLNCDICGFGGDAGDIMLRAGRLEMRGIQLDEFSFGTPRISSDTSSQGNAGNLTLVISGALVMDAAQISSATSLTGNAGTINLTAGSIAMDNGAVISTEADPIEDPLSRGNAGEIIITSTGTVRLSSGSQIVSNTFSAGSAGEITLRTPGLLLLQGGRISSGSDFGATGASGTIRIGAGTLLLDTVASIETISRNARPAGTIIVDAGDVRVSGEFARIASTNEAEVAGDAGAVTISATNISVTDGARITTSANLGAAGDINLNMPSNGLLVIASRSDPGTISTSSGPGTGGRITVSNPLAIISDGGSILALGQQGGANVLLDAQFLIRSADRLNRIDVNGDFLLAAAAYDVSAGTVNRDLSVIDASGVLRGQCAAARATGEVSQLVVRPVGPYGSRPLSSRPDPARLLSAAELQETCS